MGQLSQIRESRRKSQEEARSAIPADQRSEPSPAATITPCPRCSGSSYWESIYQDGVLRCDTCEPAPTEEIVGRRVGQQPEADASEHTPTLADQLSDPDRFVEFRTREGAYGIALRGWDNPSSPNYNQRACAYAAIGVTAYDRSLDQLQDEWREEIVQ